MVSELQYIQILRDNGIHDEFIQVDIAVPDLHGNHLASSCDSVTLHRKDGEPVELFVKREVENSRHAQKLKDMKFFEKEAGFFNSLLPDLQAFVESRTDLNTDYSLDIAPKCYFANEELIVMENLTKQDYILLDKVERQNLIQAEMVMKSLAKLHAPSYVLLTETTSVEELLERYPCLEDKMLAEENISIMDGLIVPMLGLVSLMLKANPSDETKFGAKVLEDYLEGTMKKLKPFYNLSDNDVCHVINHGDCWNCNMLFQQDPETKQLANHILIDFQVVRIGSPNLDIAYYLFTSVKHDVRRAEWLNLLRLYYDSLVQNVVSMEGKITFTFEEFVADYKRKFVPGFIFGVFLCGVAEAAKGLGNLDDVKGDMMQHYQKVVKKWMEENPDTVKRTAEQIGKIFQEYKELITI